MRLRITTFQHMRSRYVNGYRCHSIVKTLWSTMATSEQERLLLRAQAVEYENILASPQRKVK